MTTKEELLKLIPLKGKTRGGDIFNAFCEFAQERQLPMNKLVSITIDGTPAMTGKHSGFVGLCRSDDSSHFVSYHCIIHQQVLCGKTLNMKEVMDISIKIVNSVRARSL